MASHAASNFFFSFDRNIYVQFQGATSPRSQQIRETVRSRQALFVFRASALFSLLQIKYQSRDHSPFESHPVTMMLALVALMLYCLSCDAKLRISDAHSYPRYRFFLNCCTEFFAPLSLAALSSILFPPSISPFQFSLSLVFSMHQAISLSRAKAFWNWLRATLFKKSQQEEGRSGTGLVGLPWFTEQAITDNTDTLLPV